jgi:curli biogenesis system outer membrane secretion channel CsgG
MIERGFEEVNSSITSAVRGRTAAVLALLLCGVVSTAQAQAPKQKRRVAVLNFEYGTVSSSVAQIFGTNVDIGKGICDILVDRLVTGGVYSVIERKALDKVLAEQNMSNSDRFDSNSAAKIGKLLGVEGIIVGSITQFGRDDSSVNAGGIGQKYGSKIGLGNIGKKSSKAVVQISARMISVDTAEVLTVAQGKGESTRSGLDLAGGAGGRSGFGAGGLDMRSSNFANTILGEAVNKAVTEMASKLESTAPVVPVKAVVIDALVADVSGSTIIINAGSKAGVNVGDKLAVRRPGREIKDPATGKVLRRIEEPLGELSITEVDGESATGTFSGAGKPRVGDAVRTMASK